MLHMLVFFRHVSAMHSIAWSLLLSVYWERDLCETTPVGMSNESLLRWNDSAGDDKRRKPSVKKAKVAP